jgi:2-dehydropantoate 2-reductase
MRIAIIGSGAVGGYFGAKLAKAGQQVIFIARGAHLEALRRGGMRVASPALGDFQVPATAEERPSDVGPVDLVIYAVKTYDNAAAIPTMRPLVGADTAVLTLQNGVDSTEEIAAVLGEHHVLGGTTYLATALAGPGHIVQTGVHRSIILGEVFGERTAVSSRVSAIAEVLAPADIQVTAVPDARVPIWDKFVYLAPFAGFTGASRLPIGYLWRHPQVQAMFYAAAREVAAIAAAEGVTVSADRFETLATYMNGTPFTTRSSLLSDLDQGKRIELAALHGAAVRRAAAHGVPVPILATLHAVLSPWEGGDPRKTPGARGG